RGRKLARRHPALVGSTVLVLLLSTAGLMVNQALLSREEARTKSALGREHQRALEAERRLRQTRQMVDLVLQVAAEELDDKPSVQGRKKRLLETVLTHYQQLAEDNEDDLTAAELEQAQERVKRILADLAVLQGGDHLMLLYNPAVLEELGLELEQREDI